MGKEANKNSHTLWKSMAIGILCIILIGLYAFIFKCPSREWLGICCPGCGLTRACLAALRLDFGAAFYYHPLFWLVAPTIVLFLFRKPLRIPLSSKWWTVIGITVAFLMVAQFIIRLCLGSDVVYIDPTRGYLYKILISSGS